LIVEIREAAAAIKYCRNATAAATSVAMTAAIVRIRLA